MGLRDRIRVDPHDYTLLLIGAHDKPVKSELILQNMVWVGAHTFSHIRKHSQFIPTKFGPHCKIIEKDIKDMVRDGSLSIERGRISLTTKGKRIQKKLLAKKNGKPSLYNVRYGPPELDITVKSIIDSHKEFFNPLSKHELFTFMFAEHPEMVVPSEFSDEIKLFSIETLYAMIGRRRFSVARAAGLMGKPLHVVLMEAKRRGSFEYRE